MRFVLRSAQWLNKAFFKRQHLAVGQIRNAVLRQDEHLLGGGGLRIAAAAAAPSNAFSGRSLLSDDR